MESLSKVNAATALRRIQSFWLSNLVHDLRNSLFVARGYTRMVLEDREGSLGDTHRRYLCEAAQHIGKAFGLVGEFDDFPGQAELSLEDVSLRTLLRHELANASAGSQRGNVRFIEQIPNNPLRIIGDAAKLASAVQAFLKAAVDFTGPGGSVCVEATDEQEKIVLRVSATGGGSNPAPDISAASKILRLHGATVFFRASAEQGFLLQCDLPCA
jgi:signal transduction histidine kinase